MHPPMSEIKPFEANVVKPRSWWLIVLLIPFWCVVVPLRLISYTVIFFSLWLSCKLLLIGAHIPRLPNDPPLGKFRSTLIEYIVCFFLRCILLVAGVHTHIRYTGSKNLSSKVALQQLTHGIIISNHVGYLDALVITAYTASSPLAKAEIHNYRFFGVFGDALQAIWVERSNKEDRKRVQEMILTRAIRPDSHSVLAFVEGTNTNGRSVIQFQKGIFTGGLPVRPVAFRCNFTYFDPAHLMENLGIHGFKLMLLNVYHSVELLIMDEYTPSVDEQKDAVLYAGNVQRAVANALDIPCSPLTAKDNPSLAIRYKRNEQTPIQLQNVVVIQ